ncbi:MAG: acyl-CoA dehydrogenase family protein [Alphaproteobacteria bacterium]|nr:acyl-CoA dehydrogenase family protein [Alphaproteobacteria bacterium]
MDFEFTEEQRLLRESLDRLLGDAYGFDKRKTYLAEADGFSAAMWSQYAELGLLGLPFAEEHGGFGGNAVDVMIVMEAFGRVLALEPYLATVVLAGTALGHAGSAAQNEALVPQIVDGSLRLAVAHGERQARYDLNDVLTTATKTASGWRLDGAKSVVVHGDTADKLIVSARVSGDRHDRDGIGLFLVDAQAGGVARRSYKMRDGTSAADIALSDVDVPTADVLGELGNALATLERVNEAGIMATCAEAVGTMETMLAMTLEYMKTRVQFGKPIGENQALQHRASEMMIELEKGRSLAMLAAIMVDDPNAERRARDLSTAKVGVGQAARFVSQNAIQLHGGIGMTEEYAVGHYFRRCMVIEHSFGDTGYHLSKLAAEVA